jgi:hypothetical protein
MVQGWSKVSQTSLIEILSALSHHKFFFNFKDFFDDYFVAKSRLRLLKLPVEFNDDSKNGLGFKILSWDIGKGDVHKLPAISYETF